MKALSSLPLGRRSSRDGRVSSPRPPKFPFRTAGAILGLAVLPGCSLDLPHFGNQIEIEVLVPASPESWRGFGPLEHLVVVPHPAEGASPIEVHVAAGEPSVRLRFDKRTNLPVLAYPLLAGRADLLRPAGAVFPLDVDGRGRLPTSYREGFLSQLLAPVSSQSGLLEAINVRRLGREIWERSKGDPWRLDREAILQTLVYGSMRSDQIRSRPSFSLSLDAAAGTWICGNPFRMPQRVEPLRPVMDLEDVPSGTHHFFRFDGEVRDRLDLQVDERGWIWMSPATGCGGCGTW